VSVDATSAWTTGDYHHDLAWLATDKYFQLKLRASKFTGAAPLSTAIMASPVVVGVKPAVARALRDASPDHQISWADLADAAGAGTLRFGMADPRQSGSALAALVGVATAAAGTGRALRPGDGTVRPLRGVFVGHTRPARTPR